MMTRMEKKQFLVTNIESVRISGLGEESRAQSPSSRT